MTVLVTGGCGSAYEITIDSDQFQGKRLIQQHRLVTEVKFHTYIFLTEVHFYILCTLQALGEEMKTIHAVTIKIGTPDKPT